MNDVAPQRTEKLWVASLRMIGSLLYAGVACALLFLSVWGAPTIEKNFGDVVLWSTCMVEEGVLIHFVCVLLLILIFSIHAELAWRLSPKRSTTVRADQ